MATARRALQDARTLVCGWALTALATCAGAAALAPDYGREERLAREIEPTIVAGEPVYLATPSRAKVLALYTEVAEAKAAVILVHGLGLHPDWELIGATRTGLADAGFTTLSVQMPVLAADARREDYDALFPLAGERLGAAISFLRRRGAPRVAIVAHSLGAAMSNAYLAITGPP